MQIPGFVDLQVNGFQGVDFTRADLRREEVEQVEKALKARGTFAYCPTLITASDKVYAHALPMLANSSKGERAQSLGIHLEGSFINPADGVRGVHPLDHVRPPSIENFRRLQDLAGGQVAILTLAPEMPGGLELIAYLAENTKVLPAIGHSLADRQTIKDAVSAGARMVTHLGNGLPDMLHRHNNPIWPALAEDRLTALCVADGFHLPSDFLKVLVRTKRPDRLAFASDMVYIAGLPPGDYDFHGVQAVLEPDGRLHRKGAYQLCGAARDLFDCARHLASLELLSDADLARALYENPLRLLGRAPEDVSGGCEDGVTIEKGRVRLLENI